MCKQFMNYVRVTFIIMVMLLSTLSIPSVHATIGASQRSHYISFVGNDGYYAKDGNIYHYDKTSNVSSKLAIPLDDIVSVVWDGTHLYAAKQNTNVTAYHLSSNTITWEYSGMINTMHSLGNTLYLKDDNVYMGVFVKDYYEGNQMIQLDAKTGTELKNISGSYRKIEGNLPYEIKNDVYYAGKDIGYIGNTEGKFIQLSGTYVTSILDEASNQVFAIQANGSVWTTTMDKTPAFLSPYETPMKLAGSNFRALLVDGEIVILAIDQNEIIWYTFNGVGFERHDSGITNATLENIAFEDGTFYVVNASNEVKQRGYTSTVRIQKDAQAQQLQNDILAFKQANGRLTLEKKAEVEALQARYDAFSPALQEQVYTALILKKYSEDIQVLQTNVDNLNAEIDKLKNPEDFPVTDKQAALDLQKIYNKMNAYDKTLVNVKLLHILEKIKAFDVYDEINTLPSYEDVGILDLPRIQEIQQNYANVKDEWKKEVRNYVILVRLENRIYEMLNGNTLGDAYWSNFGGNAGSNALTNTKTPLSSDDVLENFTLQGKYQESIIVDDRIYTIRDKKYLSVIDTAGNVISETKLYASIGFFSRLAYGDGKIFVPLKDRIQAFDAKTLRPLWLSEAGNQMISTVTYYNGHIYSGMTTGGGGDQGKTNGFFFALNVEDEDTSSSYEIKPYAWTCGEVKNTGYYWAGAAIVNNAVVFAGDSGELISHHLSEDRILDRYVLGDTKVRANITYMEDEQAVLVGSQDSHTIFKIEMNENGTFKKDTVKKINDIGEVTGGIAYYKGRAYIPSGGMYAKGFRVVDTSTMQLAYKIEDIGTQSYPLISTAYATKENGYQVQVYVIDYNSGDVHVLTDTQGQRSANTSILRTGYGAYNSGSVTPDAYGNLYITGASFSGGGPMYSIKSKQAQIDIDDMERLINNFPSDFTYRNKKEFLHLLQQFQRLSKHEQEAVSNRDVLESYEVRMQELTNTKLLGIQSVIDQLPEVIRIQDKADIEYAMHEYASLLEIDKTKIRNYELLGNAYDQILALMQSLEQLIQDIEAIDVEQLTLSHQAQINELVARYEALSDADKVNVTNYAKLQASVEKLKELADALLVPELNEAIEHMLQLQQVSLHNEKEILQVYQEYMKLSNEIKKQIIGFEDFKKMYDNIVEQRSQVDTLNQEIWDSIQPLDIQYKDRDIILALWKKYEELPLENRVFIKYYDDLVYAKSAIDGMDHGVLTAEIFERIKQANTTYTFTSRMKSGHAYAYMFEGETIVTPKDFAYGISHTSIYEKEIRSLAQDATIVSFAHTGTFPGPAKVMMEVDVEDGDYHLYYYNAILKKAELHQVVSVEQGVATFYLTHASTYFLTKSTVDEVKVILPSLEKEDKDTSHRANTGVPTGDTTNKDMLLYMLIVSGFGYGYMIFKNKKRNIICS